jgi:C-terminal processing protease CtpA/Prc
LTSNDTFSGGEEFAYVLQQRKRAVIVGERTKGGANPGMVIRITPEFEAFIPMGRAVHPLTGTNWEGVGVQPDIETVGDNDLEVAYRLALSNIADDSSLPERVRNEGQQALKSF